MDKLVEYLQLGNKPEDIGRLMRVEQLSEAEGAEGKAVYKAPVWELDVKNLNGHTYTTELARRICEENKVTIACDGHSADFIQEFGATKAVCHDPYIEGKYMWVYVDFTDDQYRAMLEDLIERGVPIGVSSVGWGEQDRDGIIKAETYTLVRYLDFVSLPAGGVYLQKKEGVTEPATDDSLEESEKGRPTVVGPTAEWLASML